MSRRAVHSSAQWSQAIVLSAPFANQPSELQKCWQLVNVRIGNSTLIADEEVRCHGRILQKYAGPGISFDARILQLDLTKHGLLGDLFLSNTLVNRYAKSGKLPEARRWFDEMPQRNTVSWTCLISGYTQGGQPEEACRLFKSMVSAGFSPSKYTFGSVLRCCQDSGPFRFLLGAQIHGIILKCGYSIDPVACNALISMYGRCSLDSMASAHRAFEDAPKENLESWNSIISVCSQNGEAASAYQLFDAMRTRDLKPDEYSFGSLITATYPFSSDDHSLFISLLDQLLSQILKSGFLSDLYVGSALVSAFSRLGVLHRAKMIFFQMQKKNAISMNGLMAGLVKQKRGEEAALSFRETDDPELVNTDTFVILLSACTEFSMPESGKKTGREIHAFVTRNGLDQCNVAIRNGLVNMYAKCSAIDHARKVFDIMEVKDQVSWNSMISGFDQNGLFMEALTSFHQMRGTNITPSNFTLISALSSCSSLENLRLGEQLHSDGVKLGLDSDISVSNALLMMYGDCGQILESQRVFSSTHGHDLVSWNSMISVLADSETHLPSCMKIFKEMIREGWHPNKITIMNILAASSSLSVVNHGSQVHALVVKHGMTRDVAVENAMILFYARSGWIEASEELFSAMSERRDDLSWNSMVNGYVENGLLSKAVDLVWLMASKSQRLDNFTFATILSGCATAGALERGIEMHGFIVKSEANSDVVMESALVDMYAKCGRLEYAGKVFDCMLTRNKYSWNSMISGYARHGDANAALRLFEEMKLSSQRPDDVTFIGVLSACSHGGLVEEGLQHFHSMVGSYGVEPRMEHFSCVIDLLGRAGRIEEMHRFLRKMPMEPNSLVWRTVLSACFRAGDRSHENSTDVYGELMGLIQKTTAIGYAPQTGSAFYDVDLEEKEQLLLHHSEKLALAFVLSRSSTLPIRIMKNLRVCGDCHLFFRCSSKVIGREIILRDSIRFHHFADGNCSCGDYW